MKMLFQPLKLALALLFLLFAGSTSAQLTLTSTNTASVCFNDGSIIANATGGSIPYTFVITTGPTVAGMVYPLSPTNGVNQFLSIPAGVYTLQVTDNLGATTQITTTVAGNYQFPTLNAVVINNGIGISATASLGRAPYTFEISRVSSSGPFGAQQATGRFDTLCNGTYYVRVTDDCGNIYTTLGIIINRPPIDLSANSVICQGTNTNSHNVRVVLTQGQGTPTYVYECWSGGNRLSNNTGIFQNVPGLCPDTVFIIDACGVRDSVRKDCNPIRPYQICSDCINHTVTIGATGGSPPYTYTVLNNGLPAGTNLTGIFTNLPNTSYFDFWVQDGCGRKATIRSNCFFPQIASACPFNNDVEGQFFGTPDYPVTITCTTCVPPISIVVNGPFDPATLNNVPAGQQTFTITDSCGAPIVRSVVVGPSSVLVNTSWRSCNDVSFTAFTSDYTEVTTDCLFELTNSNGFYQSNMTGIFDDIPDGIYFISVSYPTCLTTQFQISFPHFPSFCMFPTFNQNCTPSYDLKLPGSFFTTSDLPENISLRSLAVGVSQSESPQGPYNGSNFYDLPVGNYTMSSDSGCSKPFILAPHPVVAFTGYDSVDCLDNRYIIARTNPPFITNNCGDTTFFTYRLYKEDSLMTTNLTGDFLVPDTGLYSVRLYYRIGSILRYPAVPYTFNDSCAVDTAIIYARPKTLPIIHSDDVQICGLTATGIIKYTIEGGVNPYTLHIPNVGTYAVTDTQGVLTPLPSDNYTMIVYDNCGISNSLTVTIADTCFECGTLSLFLPEDTNGCSGTTVTYTDTSLHAQEYNWYVNGNLVSQQATLNLTFDTVGSYTIMNIAANVSCIDTTIRVIRVTSVDSFTLGSSIEMCYGDTITLASPFQVSWFNGENGFNTKVFGPGDYWATSSNQCGMFTDTVKVIYKNITSPDLGSVDWLCTGDSLLLHAGSTFTNYQWQNGSTDSLFTVHTPGIYWVHVVSDSCLTGDTIQVTQGVEPPLFALPADTAYCDTFTRVLQTPYANTYWSTGDTAQQILVTQGDIYWAEVQNNCGTLRDSVNLRVVTLKPYTLGTDTFICDYRPYLLSAPANADSVLWSTGSKLYEIQAGQPGTYWVIYHKEMCQWADSIAIENSITPRFEFPAITPSCGNEYTITPALPEVNYVWGDGSQANQLHVTQSGIYTVTATNRCGSDSAEVNVLLMGDDCRVVVPNAFTPNNDGKNDVFKVLALCPIEQYSLRIYNRWGQMVLNSTDIDQGWDGTFKGEAQQNGTYIIYLRYFDGCENAINTVQTEVTLVR